MTHGGEGSLGRNLPWLYAGRGLRSLSTAFLGVIAPLYLAQLGYSSTAVGVVFTVSSAIVALLVLAVGVAGDRIGRRRVLIGLGLLGAAGGVLLTVNSTPALITIGCGLAAVGRGGGVGGGGGWGPFFPAEQPLLAASVTDASRTAAFGKIGFIGVLAGAAGAAVAMTPAWLHAAGWTWLSAYRLLFGFGVAISVVLAALCIPLRDPESLHAVRPDGRPPGTDPAKRDPDPHLPPSMPAGTPRALSTRQLITRLGLTSAVNGLGVGFLGPILVYWLHRRYGVGPGEVGVLYLVANLLSALPYLGVARLAGRIGAVRVVTFSRVLSTAFLLLMAWCPSFLLAGLAFIMRSGVNSLSIPARQSYVMGVAPAGRRGTVAALGGLPSQVTASVSPAIAGTLMNSFLDVPIYGAALSMTVNAVIYWFSFRHVPPPEEAPGTAMRPHAERA